ncbi:MAG: diacylglycerol kinase family protein, partial [Cytophagaceae bacterium]
GLFVNLSQYDWLWILLAIFSVWVTESFNTALEKMVDMISLEKSELAKTIKDVSAGAVLIAALFSLLVGILIFTPYVAELLKFG